MHLLCNFLCCIIQYKVVCINALYRIVKRERKKPAILVDNNGGNNMKKRKRMILPILLVLAMLAALTLPAFAESDLTGEIEAGPVDENAASLSSGEENPASTENQENTDAPEEEESTEISVPADQGYDEIFVASYGSDSADGSRANPLASLAEAARRANESSKGVVYVLLLTDLVSSDCACFFGHDVYLCSDGETATVTRSQGFLPTWDAARGKYHPAMVECGDVTDTSYTPARLFIDNTLTILGQSGA